MSKERVLVVDDDAGLLNLMSMALSRRGFQVEQAMDGKSAIRLFEEQYQAGKEPFAVLLTDLRMPEMTGLELLREIKKRDPAVEAVVATAAPDLESAIAAMRADGAYDYLLKPFESMNQLVLGIERAAEHHRLLVEREAMRIRMEREAEMLRALVSNTGDAIISANPNGQLQIINPAAVQLLVNNGSGENLEGKNASEVLPPHFTSLIQNWESVGSNLPAMIEMTWPNGTVQMVSLTPLRQDAENRSGWVAVLRDITHLKQMDEMKTQLLIEAAGKIRIPLAHAMNALVELSILSAQNERLSEIVSRLTQTWERIKDWGDDLSALLNIGGQKTIQRTNMNLSKLLHQVSQSHTETVSGRFTPVKINLDIAPDLQEVLADPELLDRLLKALVMRAAMRSTEGSIRLRARNNNNQVWVSVSDDGPAISDGELPHFFEKSFLKTGPLRGSTGLEMALVKTIIDRMEGQIWVGGDGNKGSTIIVCLPAAHYHPA